MYVKFCHSHVAGGFWTKEKEKRSKPLLNNPPHYFIFISAVLY